jgi:hypothetical protein
MRRLTNVADVTQDQAQWSGRQSTIHVSVISGMAFHFSAIAYRRHPVSWQRLATPAAGITPVRANGLDQ